jgi:hypothetical protein
MKKEALNPLRQTFISLKTQPRDTDSLIPELKEMADNAIDKGQKDSSKKHPCKGNNSNKKNL